MYISSANSRVSIGNSNWNSFRASTSQNDLTSTISKKDASTNRAAMRDLVDKVAGGTASESDVQNLTAKLKEMAADAQSRFGNTSLNSGSTSDIEMKSLMEKVENGTATTDDVKSVASKMKERASDMQAHFGGMSNSIAQSGMLPGDKPPEGAGDVLSVADSGSSSDDELLKLLEVLTDKSEMFSRDSTDTTANSSNSSTAQQSSLLSSQQLMDSFMQDYSQNYSKYFSTSTQGFNT